MRTLIVSCLVFCTGILSAQEILDASVIRLFNKDKMYARVNLYFIGHMLPYELQDDSTLKATLDVTLLFKKGNEVVKADRLAVNSPSVNNKSNFFFTKSYALDTGNYLMSMNVKSLGEEESLFSGSSTFNITDVNDIDVSDILLLSDIKTDSVSDITYGLDLHGVKAEYLPFNFIHKNLDVVQAFSEITLPENSEKTYLLSESLSKYENGKWNSRGARYQRLNSIDGNSVIPYITNWNMQEIVSGEYKLKISVVNKNKEVLASSETYFIRSNPKYDSENIEQMSAYTYLDTINKKSMMYAAKATAVTAPSVDVPMLNYLIANENIKGIRAYLYKHWADQSPTDPYSEFKKYMQLAQRIDDRFNSGFRNGFETDRGRVMLEYGKPNEVVGREQDLTSVPYEIWTYNQIEETGQTNVKFVFYNPSLVTNDLELIHSTAYGEIKNYDWERMIYSDAQGEFDGPNHIDATRMQDNINRNARRLYDDN